MHTTQQLRDYADTLEGANVHEDMGLALSLSQAADLLRWAAAELAARDHLRARLRALYDTWMQASADYRANADAAYSDDVAFMWSARGERSLTCAADLLAVLTEPPQEEKSDEKGNKDKNLARVVTMGDGSDSRTASDARTGRGEPITPDQARYEARAFKAGYHCQWIRNEGRYIFDPAFKPGDPDGAFAAWKEQRDDESQAP